MRAYVMIKMKCSRCGQRVDNGVFVDDYTKEKYAGKLNIFVGIERDFYGRDGDRCKLRRGVLIPHQCGHLCVG